MGVSKNRCGPQIINFNRVFHYKKSILGYPYFWKHPNSVFFFELVRVFLIFRFGRHRFLVTKWYPGNMTSNHKLIPTLRFMGFLSLKLWGIWVNNHTFGASGSSKVFVVNNQRFLKPLRPHVFAELHEQSAAEKSRFGKFCKKHRRPLRLDMWFLVGWLHLLWLVGWNSDNCGVIGGSTVGVGEGIWLQKVKKQGKSSSLWRNSLGVWFVFHICSQNRCCFCKVVFR